MKTSETLEAAYGRATILITGAGGFIGTALAKRLAAVDCNLILLARVAADPWWPASGRARISTHIGDVACGRTWQALLPSADVVFHLAALEYHRGAYCPREDLRVNVGGVLELVEACRRGGFGPRIVFPSSVNLYGQVDRLPLNESFADNPPSIWSAHKLMAEHYLRLHGRLHGLKSTVLRLTNVYGPPACGPVATRGVVNRVISAALGGAPLRLYANRRRVRDFIYGSDVVEALLRAGMSSIMTPEQDLFVVGSGEGNSFEKVWHTIADAIEIQSGQRPEVEVDESEGLEQLDQRDSVADSSAFMKASGWRPQVFLETGIARTVASLVALQKK